MCKHFCCFKYDVILLKEGAGHLSTCPPCSMPTTLSPPSTLRPGLYVLGF